MSCDVLPTGPCTLVPDGDPCVVLPIEDPSIPNLKIGIIQGFTNTFVFEWAVDTPDPEAVAVIYLREKLGGTRPPAAPTRVPWDDTSAVVSTLQSYTVYTIWVRVELPGRCSPWDTYEGITDPAWSSGSEIVYYRGEEVYHGTDIVLID